MNINEFKPGDIITRSEPSIEIVDDFDALLGIPTKKEIPYFDQIGERLIFKGVKHNTAYFDAEFGSLKVCVHPEYHVDWKEGWELYAGPFEELKPLSELPNDEQACVSIFDFLQQEFELPVENEQDFDEWRNGFHNENDKALYENMFKIVDFIRSIGYESKTARK